MRKIVAGLVGAALVAALVVVLLAVTGSDDPDGDGGAARDRSGDPTGTVYRTKDVVTAVEGQDYEVVRLIPGEIAYKAELMLSDGALVLWHKYRSDHSDGAPLPDLVQVWDPETGERETLPIRWRYRIGDVTATTATDLWVSFTQAGRVGKRLRVMHFDRTTGEAAVYTAPPVDRARSDHWLDQLRPGGDGRLYFMTGREACFRNGCADGHEREVWSFDPRVPRPVRREGAGGTDALTVTGGIVASLEQVPVGTTVLRIRARGSTETREVRMTSCVPYRLVASDRFVLSSCGVLYDARAEPVATFRIQSHGLSGVGDRWVAFGRTVYDTETGRLLRIAEERFWHDRRVLISDDLVLFPTGTEPPNTRNGTWTLARILPR